MEQRPDVVYHVAALAEQIRLLASQIATAKELGWRFDVFGIAEAEIRHSQVVGLRATDAALLGGLGIDLSVMIAARCD